MKVMEYSGSKEDWSDMDQITRPIANHDKTLSRHHIITMQYWLTSPIHVGHLRYDSFHFGAQLGSCNDHVTTSE